MHNIENKINNRNDFIDYLKGVAIFLVIWGHAIQYSPHNNFDFLLNSVFIFIYSFHMPLFMFISGYLYLYSFKNRSFKKVLQNRFFQLIIPIMSWSLVYNFLQFVIKFKSLQNTNFFRQISIFFISYIKSLPYELWFLWAVFYCSIITIICKSFFKDNIYSYIIIFVIMLLIPDNLNSQMVKFMFPYFAVGYLYNKNKNKCQNYLKYIKSFSFIVFPILLLFWNKDYYIYTTGMSIYVQNITYKIFIIMYRYLAGFVGIVFIIQVVKKSLNYLKLNFFTYIGKDTLGIYIISGYMMIFLTKIPIYIENKAIYNFIFTPLITILVIFICIFFTKLLQKYKYTNKLLLGGR